MSRQVEARNDYPQQVEAMRVKIAMLGDLPLAAVVSIVEAAMASWLNSTGKFSGEPQVDILADHRIAAEALVIGSGASRFVAAPQ